MTVNRYHDLIEAITHEDIDALMAEIASGHHLTWIDDGMQAIHLAAMIGFTAGVRALVAGGLPVNCPNNLGMTPLHYAAMSARDPKTVSSLLQLGADVNATTRFGNTPLDLAIATGHDEAADALRAAGGNLRSRTRASQLKRPYPPPNDEIHGGPL